jgi:hypothetical protein
VAVAVLGFEGIVTYQVYNYPDARSVPINAITLEGT